VYKLIQISALLMAFLELFGADYLEVEAESLKKTKMV
jgi:hypothetical protein